MGKLDYLEQYKNYRLVHCKYSRTYSLLDYTDIEEGLPAPIIGIFSESSIIDSLLRTLDKLKPDNFINHIKKNVNQEIIT